MNPVASGNELESDEEFDRLLAELPIPDSLPSGSNHIDSQSCKRKEIPESNDTTAEANCYEPIQFGQIGQYMANKRLKLKLQESALRETDSLVGPRPQFMAGLVVHVNGYTNPPLSELRKMIVVHGGTYMAYLDHKSVITHIIATALTPKKREEFRLYKVITPAWLVDSVAAGRLLNWSDYKLDRNPQNASKQLLGGEVTGGLPSAQRTLFSMTKNRDESVITETTPQHAHFAASSHSINSSRDTRNAPPTSPFQDKGKWRNIPTPPLTIAPSSPNSPFQIDTDPSNEPLPSAQASTISLRPGPITTDVSSITDSNAPNFIQDYFQRSRLHHLSTWKADLLQKVSTLSDQKSRKTGLTKKLIGDESDGRTIMHVDFDCFFISAGLLDRPDLRGKPVAVCHAQTNADLGHKSTSEIASCSYEARAFGVKNGQMLGKARELCPQIQTIPYDFKLYEEISLKFYNILLRYADELQAVSVDECLIDVSTNVLESNSSQLKETLIVNLANKIRGEIRSKTGCEASIGISHNILLAKLATKKAKPAGTYYLHGPQILQILGDLKIDDLPGVGWAQKADIEKTFEVSNVAQLGQIPLSQLIETMGPVRGKTLHLYSKGIDDRPLKSSNHDRKSVSAVVNYGIRFKRSESGGNEQAQAFVKELGVEVSRRLVELGLRGRHLTVKIMKRAANAPVESAKFLGHGICDEQSKATKISGPADSATDDGPRIGEEAWKLIKNMNIPPEDLRGIGIQIQKLEKASVDVGNLKGQSTLMFKPSKPHPKPISVPHGHSEGYETRVHRSNQSTPIVVTRRQPVASTSKNIIQTPHVISSQLEIPSSSQIDREVLNALPTPMKTSIMNSIDLSRPSAAMVTPANKSRKPSSSFNQIPSASQVDWTVLAQLPSSVRKPIEALYEQRKREQASIPPPPPPDFGPKAATVKLTKVPKPKLKPTIGLRFPVKNSRSTRKAVGHRVTPVGPSQRLISKKSFKLITRPQPVQADPDSSQELKMILPTPNRITDEQLEALEIDVRFFRELSSARRFQLDLIYDQYQTHQERFKEVTMATDRWKRWRKRFGQASKVISVERVPPPSLPCRTKRGGVRTFEEVGRLIEEWVESYGEEVDDIGEGDVDIVEGFLLASIDKKRGSGQELEKVYQLVIWWEEVVGKKWTEVSGVGRVRWERVIERIKVKVDQICERDHGAGLFG
ncbi:hypothetical protein CROQUDRAFT_65240 [Cronartium quercuum f. sp. fusiforme G11]|uniref:DNA repair protein REV1 n=1 Tax=Cronartium quercuum f. sp. fusiforme G11 TaxID=708437 RepID=A0A9P6TA34_9BASI|nr:hypothetical protein CROQUDRAFT_65240 [Cronartium quercuum f. sp. fusiforme G11]